jgi:hypothetical protein
LEFDGSGGTVSVAKEGWDFESDSDLFLQTNPDHPDAHGTGCAGIIGAVRNNGTGVAGIAGGDEENDEEGVGLYGLRIYRYTLPPGESEYFISEDLEEVYDAIVSSSMDQNQGGLFNYGLHVSNHSWGFGTNNLEYNEDKVQTLTDALHFANRNHVVQVAGRGNNGNQPEPDMAFYPACLDDNWVLNVSATGNDGGWLWKNNGGGNAWHPNIGRGIDVAAPGVSLHIRTLDDSGGYQSFGKTSAATAHASGSAALLLSKANQPFADPSNLAPEDVEYVLQKTATDAILTNIGAVPPSGAITVGTINAAGYDDFIGWGRINVGAAMSYLDDPQYRVEHYTGNNGIEYELVNEDVSIELAEPIESNDGVDFAAGSYTADVHRYYTVAWHSLSGYDVIVDPTTTDLPGIWERHSSSTLYPPLENGVLIPHERIAYNHTNNNIDGYVYELFDESMQSVGWLPFEPVPAQLSNQVIFAYSLLVQNTLYSSIEELDEEGLQIILSPNPTFENAVLNIQSQSNEKLTIEVFDLLGQIVLKQPLLSVPEGKTTIELNVSGLSTGMYQVRCLTDGMNQIVLPLIKTKP